MEYRLRPSQHAKIFGNAVDINSCSMRSPEMEPRKAAGELRVLVLGDSVVYGGNQVDQADLATTRLAKDLAAAIGSKVSVGNASAKSWSPGNQLAYIRRFGTFDADLVLLVISSHDLEDVPDFKALNPETHPLEKPLTAALHGAGTYLPRFFPWLKAPKEAQPAMDKDAVRAQGRSDFLALLRELADRGVPAAVLLHPTTDELAQGYEPNHRELRELAASAGVVAATYEDILAGARKAGRACYLDSIHLTADGQQALGRGLLRLASERFAALGIHARALASTDQRQHRSGSLAN